MSRINSLNRDRTSYSTPGVTSNVFNEHFTSTADNIIYNTINTEPDLTSLVDIYSETRNVHIAKSPKIGNIFNPHKSLPGLEIQTSSIVKNPFEPQLCLNKVV